MADPPDLYPHSLSEIIMINLIKKRLLPAPYEKLKFQLLRYFSTTSLFAFIVVTLFLGVFYRNAAVDDLIKNGESKNVALTQAFSNSLWREFSPFLNAASSLGPDDLRAHPETTRLRQAVLAQMENLSVVKVKIYNLAGMTLFSTQQSQIGEDKSSNTGFLSARNGGVASELAHRDTFSAFEEIIVDRDLFSSYVPIWKDGPGSTVVGVFEVYDDITPLVHRIKQTQTSIFVGVTAVLALLYGFLLIVVKHADSAIKSYQRERNRAEEALQRARDELEIKVQERTAELRESEERYMLAALGSNDGLWDWNINSQEIHYSQRWYSLLGLDDHHGPDKEPEKWFSLTHPEDLERLKADINAHLENTTPHLRSEFRMLHTNGGYLWMLCRGQAIRDQAGKAYRLAGSLTDITRQKETEQQLLHNAFHDTLTGLPNRALFMERLNRAAVRARRRSEYAFAVIFLDLDHFKLINDSLGHSAGDQLLKDMSHRLENKLRTMDTLARLGGDEFAILLDEIADVSDATRVAERILQALQLPFIVNEREVFTTASLGIAFQTTGFVQPEDILREADTAMYRAKSHGRSRYQIYDKVMHTQVTERMRLETDLRKALERDELTVYYQPIINLRSGQICSFETLVRWQHPRRGLLLPAEFIHIAEETGLVTSIDLYVLRQACLQLKRWQELYPSQVTLKASVNLSGKHFAEPGLVECVDQIVNETGINPGRLQFEITENVLIENNSTVADILSQLKERGFNLHMDDFGSGYSSLSYLHRFPFDTMKIDRSFTDKISTHVGSYKIVQTVVKLAKNLGMQVVAEGVEHDGQLEIIRALECEFAQGYYFSRPVAAQEAEALLLGVHPGHLIDDQIPAPQPRDTRTRG